MPSCEPKALNYAATIPRGMSKKKKLLLPPSAAGISRYEESDKGGLHIPPEAVIGMIIITIMVEFYLHTM